MWIVGTRLLRYDERYRRLVVRCIDIQRYLLNQLQALD